MIALALFFHLVLIFAIQAEINKYRDPYVVNSPFFNDGEAISSNGLIIAYVLRGEKIEQSFFTQRNGIQLCGLETLEAAKKGERAPPNTYELSHIGYFYGIIYAAYGYCPAFINFFNVILILLCGLVIFRISNSIFEKRTAYLTTIFFLFNPVLFYYSSTKLKDSITFFTFYLLLYLVIKWMDTRRMLYLIINAPLFFIAYFIRDKYFLGLIIFTLSLLVLYVLANSPRNRNLFALLVLAVFIILLPKIKDFAFAQLERAASYHWGNVTSGGKVYSLLREQHEFHSYNLFNWLIYFLRGWYHLIFEPLNIRAFSWVGLLLWAYKITFLNFLVISILGFLSGLKINYKNCLVLALFFLIFGTIFALTEANIVTMIRHRDLLMPIVFMFVSYFLVNFFKINPLRRL